MKRNVGNTDRIVRLVLGVALTAVGAVALLGFVTVPASTLWVALAAVALVVGLAFVATGATRKCLVYRLLGVDTLGGEDEESTEMPETGRSA